MTGFVPLLASAHLLTPPSFAQPVSGDALLTWALARIRPIDGDPVLPVARRCGVWQAGCLFFRTPPYGGVAVGEQRVKALRPQILVQDGQALDMAGTTETIDAMHRYNDGRYFRHEPVHWNLLEVMLPLVGDRDGVTELLAEVQGVGTMVQSGYGEVSGWTVREVDADPATFGLLAADGSPARILRLEDWQVLATPEQQRAVRVTRRRARVLPPYWLREDLEFCVAPTLRDVLCPNPRQVLLGAREPVEEDVTDDEDPVGSGEAQGNARFTLDAFLG